MKLSAFHLRVKLSSCAPSLVSHYPPLLAEAHCVFCCSDGTQRAGLPCPGSPHQQTAEQARGHPAPSLTPLRSADVVLSPPPPCTGPQSASLGQTHPGQVAEPQVQGVSQPVGVVGLHLSPEAVCGAGAGEGEDVVEHGLCVEPAWLGRPVPLQCEGTVRPQHALYSGQLFAGSTGGLSLRGPRTHGARPQQEPGWLSGPAAPISPRPGPCPRLYRTVLGPSSSPRRQ